MPPRPLGFRQARIRRRILHLHTMQHDNRICRYYRDGRGSLDQSPIGGRERAPGRQSKCPRQSCPMSGPYRWCTGQPIAQEIWHISEKPLGKARADNSRRYRNAFQAANFLLKPTAAASSSKPTNGNYCCGDAVDDPKKRSAAIQQAWGRTSLIIHIGARFWPRSNYAAVWCSKASYLGLMCRRISCRQGRLDRRRHATSCP